MATVWQPGMRITADRLNDTSPLDWQPWTPEWNTEGGQNPSTYGNATINCRYVQFGLLCMFNFDITFGSTTAFSTATDNWTFGLPVPASLSDAPIGNASMYPSSAGKNVTGIANLFGTNTFKIYVSAGAVDSANSPIGGWVDSNTPYVWASGNRILVVGQYETAA